VRGERGGLNRRRGMVEQGLFMRGAALNRRVLQSGGVLSWVLFAMGLLLVGGVVVGLWPKPLSVELARVSRGPLTVSVREEGKTRVRHRHVISPPFGGSLRRIGLRAGDRLEAGKTVLAELQGEWVGFLNPRLLLQAEAQVKAAEAAKERSGVAVERAQMALDLANKELRRAESLKGSGAISSKEWDAAQSQSAMLGRELRAAEFSREVAEFEWAQARVVLEQAKGPEDERTGVYRMVSPISGVVLQVMEESARVVAAGTPLMEIGDLKDLEAEVELLSQDAVGVRTGAEVTIEEWGGPGPLKAQVSAVEPGGFMKVSALGVEEQRVKVRVDFTDSIPETHRLGDRFRVEARIVVWKTEAAVLVPTGALFRRGEEWFVFLERAGRSALQRVEVGRTDGRFAEVRSGLEVGQWVVVHPPDILEAGGAIRRREAVDWR
jgi:HlyD family secretion protein